MHSHIDANFCFPFQFSSEMVYGKLCHSNPHVPAIIKRKRQKRRIFKNHQHHHTHKLPSLAKSIPGVKK